MQYLDLPIEDKEKDKLNFSPFAQKVAKGIKNYKWKIFNIIDYIKVITYL